MTKTEKDILKRLIPMLNTISELASSGQSIESEISSPTSIGDLTQIHLDAKRASAILEMLVSPPSTTFNKE